MVIHVDSFSFYLINEQSCEGFQLLINFGCILRSKNKMVGLVTFEKAPVIHFVSKKVKPLSKIRFRAIGTLIFSSPNLHTCV